MKKLDIFEIMLPPEQKVVFERPNDLARGWGCLSWHLSSGNTELPHLSLSGKHSLLQL